MEMIDNGYGQYVVLDLNETIYAIGSLEQDHFSDYSRYLDKHEHMLDYGSNVYIYDNMVTSISLLNTRFISNPVVYIFSTIINWFY